jgi:hypothetical protein
MSRSSVLTGLGSRNAFRATARLAILILLLASALVARSLSGLSQAGLCREAVDAVSANCLPGNANCIVYSPLVAYTPETLSAYFRQFLGFSFSNQAEYITARRERYVGPTGPLSVVRPSFYRERSTRRPYDPHLERNWFTEINGRFPTRTDEVAIPATLAQFTGLGPGDKLALSPIIQGAAAVTFTITGVYTPLGYGAAYDYLLSIADSDRPLEVNLLIGRLSPRAIEIARSWGGSGTAEVTVYADPKAKMADLARTVYSSQSSAMTLGFGLIGVAVLVILLVAMVERRREAAIYKMVGLDSLATLRVLAVELAWSLAIALGLATPAYWHLATRYVLDVHASGPAILAPPYLWSLAWTILVAALGAAYPFALASLGTPSQLLTNQKIYIFRRRQVLRGWADVGSG